MIRLLYVALGNNYNILAIPIYNFMYTTFSLATINNI